MKKLLAYLLMVATCYGVGYQVKLSDLNNAEWVEVALGDYRILWSDIGGVTPSGWTDPDFADLLALYYMSNPQPSNSICEEVFGDYTYMPAANGYLAWRYPDGMFFDGTLGDYHSTTNSGNRLGGTVSNLSFCGWFKSDTPANEDGMLHIGTLANSQGILSLRQASGGYRCRINGQIGTDETIGGTSTTNWTHIACTYDGLNHKLYQDGVEVDNEAGSYTMSASGLPFIVGTRYNVSTLWNGNIDDVRLYGRTLSSNEVFTLADTDRTNSAIDTVATNDIVAYIPYDIDYLRVHDFSGNNNHISPQPSFANAPTRVTNGVPLGAYEYDGTDDYFATIQDAPLLEIGTGEIVIDAWIKVDAHKDYNAIAGKQFLTGAAGYGMYVDASGVVNFQTRTATEFTTLQSDSGITTGAWHHVVGMRNTTVTNELTMAIDGVLQSNTANEFWDTSRDEPFGVGATGTGARDFNGQIYVVRVYGTYNTNYLDRYNNTTPTDDDENRVTFP